MSLVVDVGDLLEDELLDLGLGDPLVGVAGAGVEQQRVAGAQVTSAQRLGQLDDALLVGVRDDQGAVSPSARTSLSITTSPTSRTRARRRR